MHYELVVHFRIISSQSFLCCIGIQSFMILFWFDIQLIRPPKILALPPAGQVYNGVMKDSAEVEHLKNNENVDTS